MCMANITHIRLAVADCIRDPHPSKRTLKATLARLPREPPEAVTVAYQAALAGRDDRLDAFAEVYSSRSAKSKRALPGRNKPGLQLQAIAAELFLDRETLARLMQRHDLLELAPYGGRQSRRLVTARAIKAGLGHNADPSGVRSVRLDGHARAAVFPVFYPDAVPAIVKLIGWDAIRAEAAEIGGKRARLRWVLDNHADLPDQALADLAGCSLRTVERAREKARDRMDG